MTIINSSLCPHCSKELDINDGLVCNMQQIHTTAPCCGKPVAISRYHGVVRVEKFVDYSARSKLKQLRFKTKRNFFAILAFWMVFNLGLAVYLYHVQWLFDLVGGIEIARMVVVPLGVLTIYFSGLYALCKFTDKEFWHGVQAS